MSSTQKNEPLGKTKPQKRGIRFEVKKLSVEADEMLTTAEKEVEMQVSTNLKPKKNLFSCLQRRKNELEKKDEKKNLKENDDDVVHQQPLPNVTFSSFNNHDNDNYRNDDENTYTSYNNITNNDNSYNNKISDNLYNNKISDNSYNKTSDNSYNKTSDKSYNKTSDNTIDDKDDQSFQLTNSLLTNKQNLQTSQNDLKTNEKSSKNHKKALIWKARRRKCMGYLKKLLGFLLSTLGLFILLFSYTIFGGFIFNRIESPNEVSTKSGVRTSLKYHKELLWNLTKALNVLKKEEWFHMAHGVIDNYTRVVFIATKNDGWDGKDDSEGELQWSFAGSLLYCVTVITTIGYGHIAPKTDLGRIVTIFYAIFGIPLCLLSITHVGGFMATVFRFLYKNIFCGLCCFCCNKIKKRRFEKSPSGKKTKSKDKSQKCCSCCGWCGCCGKKDDQDHHCTPSKDVLLTKEILLQPSLTHQNVTTPAFPAIPAPTATRRLRQSYNTIVNWRRGIHNALFTDDNKNIQVPIYISLLLIGGYIAVGALLFGLWESEWNFLIGSYFCFITLSTIGFGDFVPGTSLDPSSSQEKLVLCTFYLIIGLALLAMCFDLMQEEARSIFMSLAKKLGLISDEEEEVDDEGTAGEIENDFTTSV